MSLGSRLSSILAIDPAAPAIEYQGQWKTWGELGAATAAIDGALNAAGLGAEARVAVLLRNHVDVIPAVLSMIIGGRCLVTLNPVLPAEKVAADIAATGVPAVIGLARDLDALGEVTAAAGCLVIELTGDTAEPIRTRQQRRDNGTQRVSGDGVAVEMLTSGTTGAPKRIPMHRSGFDSAVLGAARFEKGRTGEDKPVLRNGVQLLMAPFAHIGGLLALMNALVAGRKATLLEKFNVAGFTDAVSRHGIKVASAPPAALKMILDAGVPKEALQSMQAFRAGTAPLDPDLADEFYEKYGIPVLQNYGATEFGGVAGWTLGDFAPFRQSKRGSVGRLNPGVEGRVVDVDSGKPVAVGERGILELKGAQIGNGGDWMRTTDLARLDEDGFLFILGRSDNAIIRGGFKVHPDDLVKAAESHSGVREAAVVGMPDKRLGQVPVLAYLRKNGSDSPSPHELELHLRGLLSPYQLPVAIHLFDELPRTPSLKVDQNALKVLCASLGEDAQA